MKKLTVLMFFFLLVFAGVDINAANENQNQYQYVNQQGSQGVQAQIRLQERNRVRCQGGQAGNNVGAPLDGGLLVLLAGAGITYFGARKKKKQL
jgi:hypothetical protein